MTNNRQIPIMKYKLNRLINFIIFIEISNAATAFLNQIAVAAAILEALPRISHEPDIFFMRNAD
jgi:hypothetical protein